MDWGALPHAPEHTRLCVLPAALGRRPLAGPAGAVPARPPRPLVAARPQAAELQTGLQTATGAPPRRQATSLFIPVDAPGWAQAFTRYSLAKCIAYFPLTLHQEEELRPGRPYVIGAQRPRSPAAVLARTCAAQRGRQPCARGAGYEPHSHLPIALPMVLCEFSPLVPPALKSVRALATSVIFWVPVVRHLWRAAPKPLHRAAVPWRAECARSQHLCSLARHFACARAGGARISKHAAAHAPHRPP